MSDVSSRSATKVIARFASEGSYSDIPEDVVTRAKELILDSLAVMLAGAASPPMRLLQDMVRDASGKPESSVVGTTLRLPASSAALANGSAGHALDFDDTILFTSDASQYGSRLHPSVPTLAATLALSEQRDVTGEEFLAAFIYGYEVTCRVANAGSRELYRRGYHPTGVVGPLGAALAAGRLLGLDHSGMEKALGLSASMGAGLRENYGTMTKSFHAGRSAEAGVVAANLAARGFTASDTILEGERGFFAGFCGDFAESALLDNLGDPFYVLWPGSAIKPYPTGSLSHPTLDACFKLIAAHDIGADQVEEVTVGSNSNIAGSLIHHEASDGLQAKFSIPACVALAFVERAVGLAEVTDQVVQRGDIQAFMKKVSLYVDPEIEALGFDQPRAIVNVRLKDGSLLTRRVDAAQGTTENPMSADVRLQKVRACADGVLPESQLSQVIELVENLQQQSSMSSLADALTLIIHGGARAA